MFYGIFFRIAYSRFFRPIPSFVPEILIYDGFWVFRKVFFHLLTLASQGFCVFVAKKVWFFLSINLFGKLKGSTFAPAFQENETAAKRCSAGSDEQAFFEDIE